MVKRSAFQQLVRLIKKKKKPPPPPPKNRASLIAQLVKNLPAMQETWAPSLGWEDALEKGRVTLSSILPWKIPWTV